MASSVCKPQQRFFSGDGDHLVDALVEACMAIRSKPQLPSYGRELVPALDTGYFGVILDVQHTSSEHGRTHSRPVSNGSPPRKPSGKKPRSQVQINSVQLHNSQSSDSPTSCSSEQSIMAPVPAGNSLSSKASKQQDPKFSKQDTKQSKAQAAATPKPGKDSGTHTPPPQMQVPNASRSTGGKRYDAPAILNAACPAFLSPAPRPDQLPMPASMLLRKASANAIARATSASPALLPSTPLISGICDWPSPCMLQIVPALTA